ncbi:ribonuclease HI [Candidatus Gracilibacteria bacterium]|nr:ribonuclease HI [Candidatus Gracilibacteria bacterium]
MENEKIEIYTDGSCIGNPGPGGWAFLILRNGKKFSFADSQPDTTNNRMEMTAVVRGLEWIHATYDKNDRTKVDVTVYSDSRLVIQTFNQGWNRKANLDIWSEIDRLRAWLNITWQWVKAHDTNPHNNLVDELAQKAARSIA